MGATAVQEPIVDAPTGTLTIAQTEIAHALRRLKPLTKRYHALKVARIVCDIDGRAWIETTDLYSAGRIDIVGERVGVIDALVDFEALERAADSFNKLEKIELIQHPISGYLTVRSGVGIVELAPASDVARTAYPFDRMSWPEDGEVRVHAHGNRFRYAVETAAVCASRDETRPVLLGIYLDARRGVVEATDSYRLIQTPLVGEQGSDWVLNLPARELVIATRRLTMDEGVLLYQENDAPLAPVYLRRDGEMWRLRPIDGGFPNVPALVPDDFATRIVYDRDAFAAFAARAAKASRRNEPVRIEVGDDVLRCSLRTTESELTAEVPATVTGEVQVYPLGLNPVFLHQLLRALDNGEEHIMRMNNPRKGVMFACGSDFALQMPIDLSRAGN